MPWLSGELRVGCVGRKAMRAAAAKVLGGKKSVESVVCRMPVLWTAVDVATPLNFSPTSKLAAGRDHNQAELKTVLVT